MDTEKAAGDELHSSEIFYSNPVIHRKSRCKNGFARYKQGWDTWSAEYPKFMFHDTQQLGNNSSRLQELFGRPGECSLYNQQMSLAWIFEKLIFCGF